MNRSDTMKELFRYIFRLDFKSLFVTETDNTIIQLFRYCFVGGIAFLADWLSMIIFKEAGLHYLAAAVIGFFVGLAVNFLLSKLFIFKKDNPVYGKKGEFIAYALIGAVGLGITELLMYFFTDILSVHYAVSKIIAAAIVLFWNFIARKKLLYSK